MDVAVIIERAFRPERSFKRAVPRDGTAVKSGRRTVPRQVVKKHGYMERFVWIDLRIYARHVKVLLPVDLPTLELDRTDWHWMVPSTVVSRSAHRHLHVVVRTHRHFRFFPAGCYVDVLRFG